MSSLKSPQLRGLFFLGLICALFYKIIKISIVRVDPFLPYKELQTYLSCVRVGLFLFTSYCVYKVHRIRWGEYFSGLIWLPALSLIPLGLLYFKLNLLDGLWSWESFYFELPVNIGVGFFEEFVFRGLILGTLLQIARVPIALFLCSSIFTFWHLDVVFGVSGLVFLFVWSLGVDLLFKAGMGLITLSLFHSLWDVLHFSVEAPLGGYGDSVYLFNGLGSLLVLLVGFMFLQVKRKRAELSPAVSL